MRERGLRKEGRRRTRRQEKGRDKGRREGREEEVRKGDREGEGENVWRKGPGKGSETEECGHAVLVLCLQSLQLTHDA